jgi:hypothetical protein
MNTSKSALLAASAACLLATAATAQVTLPAPTGNGGSTPNALHGAGASSIQIVLVRAANCVGRPGTGLNLLGTNSSGGGSTQTVAAGLYKPTTPSATNPTVDCSVLTNGTDAGGFPVYGQIQPFDGVANTGFQAQYVATGSGTGRTTWRNFTSFSNNPFGAWSNIQFAFSDAPAPQTDFVDYGNNANNATNKAGPAIQVPFFVLPVAAAYNPIYARYNHPTLGKIDLKFNVKFPVYTDTTKTVVAGGLRLSRTAYCKIFNGEITNWNDPALKTLNGNTDLRDANDPATRWAASGAPIRLVGRLDNSGTTDIFTRHLAAACNTLVTTNKFAQNAEALPFDRSSGINLSSFRSDTAYTPTSTRPLAGTVQSLSGAVFVRGSGGAPGTVQNAAEVAGLFAVSDGSSGVRDALNFQTEAGDNTGDIAFNARLGYIGADFVRPSAGQTLNSAALQQGTAYVMPTPTNASKAFGSILPPQSIAASGAYNITDSRTGPALDGSPTPVAIDRANPLHWLSVVYPAGQAGLGLPTVGYPITGTTNLLSYTCFRTRENRFAVTELVGTIFGKINKNNANQIFSVNTFKGTGPTSLGILTQAGIALVPAGWQTAIWETFFKKSTQDGDTTAGVAKLGDRNLWIQDKTPVKASDVDNVTTALDPKANAICEAGKGA